MQPPIVTLLRHDQVIYEDQTVILTGQAFFGCEFHRCVLVLAGFPTHVEHCELDSCIWHINMVIHDPAQLSNLMETLTLARPGLPKLPVDPMAGTGP